MFELNQRVRCINATGALVMGAFYTVTGVSPMGTAIDVMDENGIQLRTRYRDSRFEDATVPAETPEERAALLEVERLALEAAEEQARIDEAQEYDTSEFFGCCGATIVFFDGEAPDKYDLRMTVESVGRQPQLICILNQDQRTNASHRTLMDAGFVLVAQSGSLHDGALYTYVRIGTPIPERFRAV